MIENSTTAGYLSCINVRGRISYISGRPMTEAEKKEIATDFIAGLRGRDASLLDLYESAAVKGVSAVFSDLDNSCLRI